MAGRKGVEKVTDKECDGRNGKDLMKEQAPGRRATRAMRPSEEQRTSYDKAQGHGGDNMALAF